MEKPTSYSRTNTAYDLSSCLDWINETYGTDFMTDYFGPDNHLVCYWLENNSNAYVDDYNNLLIDGRDGPTLELFENPEPLMSNGVNAAEILINTFGREYWL